LAQKAIFYLYWSVPTAICVDVVFYSSLFIRYMNKRNGYYRTNKAPDFNIILHTVLIALQR